MMTPCSTIVTSFPAFLIDEVSQPGVTPSTD
jgi:hypothetical protein